MAGLVHLRTVYKGGSGVGMVCNQRVTTHLQHPLAEDMNCFSLAHEHSPGQGREAWAADTMLARDGSMMKGQ